MYNFILSDMHEKRIEKEIFMEQYHVHISIALNVLVSREWYHFKGVPKVMKTDNQTTKHSR